MEPENRLLDHFVLSLAGRQWPRVCFISTASAESPAYIVRFYRAFSGRAVPTDLTISTLLRCRDSLLRPPYYPRFSPNKTSSM